MPRLPARKRMRVPLPRRVMKFAPVYVIGISNAWPDKRHQTQTPGDCDRLPATGNSLQGGQLDESLLRSCSRLPSLRVLRRRTLLTAQFDSGQISGFVRDQTGAVVPGAAVTATNEGTKEAHRTATNAEGYYVFPQLVVGTYIDRGRSARFQALRENRHRARMPKRR